jgi:hypothetical protein
MQKYSLVESSIWTLSLSRRSLSNKGIAVSVTSRNEWQMWSFPHKHDKGWVKYHSKGWPNMLRMLTLLLDLGSGERNDRETGSAILKENDLVLLNHQEYLELFNLDVNNWSLDRRTQNPLFKRATSPLLCGNGDSVTSSSYSYRERRAMEGSGAAPLIDTPT